ncbi:MAG: hypothetical protein ACREXY_23870 [Gammaproteobacteria bacterium]
MATRAVIGARFQTEHGAVFEITDYSASKRTMYFAAAREGPRARRMATMDLAARLQRGIWRVVLRETPLSDLRLTT